MIDAKPKDLGLPTEAYIAVEEVHDVSTPIAALCSCFVGVFCHRKLSHSCC